MTTKFNFQSGDILANKYEVVNFLGGGYEGEVYRIRELETQIERAAKIFFPIRNVKGKTATTYAKRLHKLRSCPVLIHYHNIETIIHNDINHTVFISEYVEGKLLPDYLKQFRGKVIPRYQGLHLLHALAVAIESIHALGEYHGDLHAENIVVQKVGLRFELKLLDLFNLGKATKLKVQTDIVDIIKIYYDTLGGQKHYSKQPPFVKSICCGLKKTLILKKFKTASHLRVYLEAHDWN